MTPSQLMQALSEAGAPFQAILIAVQALEAKDAEIAARDAEVAERRAKDAARKREERARVHGQSKDGPETVRAATEDAPLSRPPNEEKSNPPTHTPENKTPRVKGHRLPVDWQPKPLTGALAAAVAAWPPGALERELARFRDWAASANGPNALKIDWDAAWRNWLRKAQDEGRYGSGGRNNRNERTSVSQIGRELAAGFARAGDRPPEFVPRLGQTSGHG
jgi:hypothetical protein